MCINKVSVIIGILQRIDVVIWVFKADWVHFRFMMDNCSFETTWTWCINIILLKYLGLDPYLWLFLRICYFDDFLLINNAPPKGNFSSFSSYCINNYLTYLLSIPHPFPPFRYVGDKFLHILKDLDRYYWPACLCMCWCWFGLFWWWNILPNSLLTIW